MTIDFAFEGAGRRATCLSKAERSANDTPEGAEGFEQRLQNSRAHIMAEFVLCCGALVSSNKNATHAEPQRAILAHFQAIMGYFWV